MEARSHASIYIYIYYRSIHTHTYKSAYTFIHIYAYIYLYRLEKILYLCASMISAALLVMDTTKGAAPSDAEGKHSQVMRVRGSIFSVLRGQRYTNNMRA